MIPLSDFFECGRRRQRALRGENSFLPVSWCAKHCPGYPAVDDDLGGIDIRRIGHFNLAVFPDYLYDLKVCAGALFGLAGLPEYGS